jgi:hypothetical protein
VTGVVDHLNAGNARTGVGVGAAGPVVVRAQIRPGARPADGRGGTPER